MQSTSQIYFSPIHYSTKEHSQAPPIAIYFFNQKVNGWFYQAMLLISIRACNTLMSNGEVFHVCSSHAHLHVIRHLEIDKLCATCLQYPSPHSVIIKKRE